MPPESTFKVVDSDDWVDAEALRKILNFLRSWNLKMKRWDMLISNYVYEKVGATHRNVFTTVMCFRRIRFSNGKKSDGSIWISTF